MFLRTVGDASVFQAWPLDGREAARDARSTTLDEGTG